MQEKLNSHDVSITDNILTLKPSKHLSSWLINTSLYWWTSALTLFATYYAYIELHYSLWFLLIPLTIVVILVLSAVVKLGFNVILESSFFFEKEGFYSIEDLEKSEVVSLDQLETAILPFRGGYAIYLLMGPDCDAQPIYAHARRDSCRNTKRVIDDFLLSNVTGNPQALD